MKSEEPFDDHQNNNTESQDIFSIEPCDKKSCVTCLNRLSFDNFYNNWTTNSTFLIDFNGSCQTKNCIYLIKCLHKDCKYQYIGHTINSIASRISQHKSTIKRGGGCKILRDHFTKIHSTEHVMAIMPIKLLPDKYNAFGHEGKHTI